ncbi:MAG: preprotein translocase subunit YajC [Phycisphaerales bacterium]|jgi:preprotein translocase subunit YajC|nr:preprotein translocase subunit YajC [Phycisphaerales bacterium]|tara:strand:- start:833 stop:1321 length:489 start_codon:yes stop_codon:yes gene_type:complete
MEISQPTIQWFTHAMIAQDNGSAGGVLGAPSTSQSGSAPLGTSADPSAPGAARPSGMGSLLPIMLLMMAGILVMTSLAGRKERKKHAALMAGLGKKDKVRAAGGIIGTIIELKNDEVLLETDRASNTRIRVARSSISSVIESKSTPAPEANTEEVLQVPEDK